MYSQTGRHVAIQEQGNKIIYKNVKLLSTQDTYYTKGTRTYWENGEIHGTTDFICGGGDIFFNEVLLYIDKISYITAPSSNSSYGYVFVNCTIDGSVDSYQLGRSWGDARCVFINTTMIKLPIATGWGDPMNSVPVVFAEYNSKTASGTLVDLSKRRTTYTKDVTVTLNPVLSASQAAGYTVEKVLSGSDNWKPNELVKQVNAPVVLLDGLNLTWNDDENALCWVVFKDGKYFKCVTTPYCAISTTDLNGKYTVRAANSMGGLGATSNIIDASATLVAERKPADSKSVLYCNPAEKTIYIQTAVSKMLKVNIFSLNGKTILSKKFNAFSEISGPIEIPFGELTSGIYLIRSEFDGSVKSEYLNLQY